MSVVTRNILLALCIFSAAFCLALGITLPLIEFERLYFFTETPSLAQIIIGLLNDGSIFLGAIIAVFSVLFPMIKIVGITLAAIDQAHPAKALFWTRFAKWSLLDVFLVALLIFASKTSGLASVTEMSGFWFFVASIVFCTAADWLVKGRNTA